MQRGRRLSKCLSYLCVDVSEDDEKSFTFIQYTKW